MGESYWKPFLQSFFVHRAANLINLELPASGECRESDGLGPPNVLEPDCSLCRMAAEIRPDQARGTSRRRRRSKARSRPIVTLPPSLLDVIFWPDKRAFRGSQSC
jgi:hypothetical protein